MTERAGSRAHRVAKGRKPRSGNVLYQPVGKGKNRRLKLRYVLTKSANQPGDVPFESDFESKMRKSAEKHFPQRMMEAMKTRKWKVTPFRARGLNAPRDQAPQAQQSTDT